MFTFFLPAGLYPEIPEGSQLDFSALKEEVPLYSLLQLLSFIYISFVVLSSNCPLHSVNPIMLPLCFD